MARRSLAPMMHCYHCESSRSANNRSTNRSQSVRSVVLWSVAFISAVSACDDTARGIERDAHQAEEHIGAGTSEAQANVNQEMAEFRRESQAMLREMDAKLLGLERSLESASAEAKVKAQDELRELRRECEDLARKLDQAHAKSKAELNETEREFDQSLAQLGKDINHA